MAGSFKILKQNDYVIEVEITVGSDTKTIAYSPHLTEQQLLKAIDYETLCLESGPTNLTNLKNYTGKNLDLYTVDEPVMESRPILDGESNIIGYEDVQVGTSKKYCIKLKAKQGAI